MYLILSNKGWGWCSINTVCVVCVCVNSLDNFVLSVPVVCVGGVFVETKSGA